MYSPVSKVSIIDYNNLMTIQTKTFYKISELQNFLKAHTPSLFTSSKTSTVIPFDLLEKNLENIPNQFAVIDLNQLPKKMELLSNNNLLVEGPVTWKEAREFLLEKKRNLKTYPTEILASILAGVATSCTGERSFGFSNLRSQIQKLTYLNYLGVENILDSNKPFDELNHHEEFKKYTDAFLHYKNFKNAPYPRFETEVDLMIGTEGQLGIVTSAEIKTIEDKKVNYLFILLPSWEENLNPHLELHQSVQHLRGKIYSCELVDHNAMGFLLSEDQLGKNQDVVFMEIESDYFEFVMNELLTSLKLIKETDIFEISREKFHHVRASVPRRIFERNAHMKVTKMGTDAQVTSNHFKDLLEFYRTAKKVGISYNLFGHFGDAHLHFNFMPLPHEISKCQSFFYELYEKLLSWNGSPFAEHGIGLLKKNYIKSFHKDIQKNVFKILKNKYDPHRQFFPQGFMNE